MARGPRQATFDIASVARNAPDARRRTPWMSDDAGDLAAAALERHPKKYRIKPEEVIELVRVMASLDSIEHRMAKVEVGGVDIHLRNREINFEGLVLYHTPRTPGLHGSADIPQDPGLEERAIEALRRHLRQMKHDDGIVHSVVQQKIRRYGFDSAKVHMTRPEGGGAYMEYASLEHRTPDEFEREIAKIADNAVTRHKARFHLMGARHGAEEWARHVASTIDGVEYERTEVSYYQYNKDRETISSVTCTCVFRALGDRLMEQEVTCTGHDMDGFRSIVAGHRRATRKMKNGAPVESRTVHPLVAAAVRAKMDEYGADILKEIEAVLEGRGDVHPVDPVKRGMTTFRMVAGELQVPVVLAKNLKFEKDRVVVRRVKDLPSTIMNAIPGQPLSSIVEHPWLKGLTVRTAILNSKGLCLRPDYAPEPLQPLLDELRSRFGTVDTI